MKKKIQIALLDSGITEMSNGYRSNISYIDNESSDLYGHGTMCFNLMKKYIGLDCDINVIKVLNNQGLSNILILNNALSDLIYSDINIINLSLSVTKEDNTEGIIELHNICDELFKNKKIIICSLKNRENEYSIPSGYNSVIGVNGACFTEETKYWYDNHRKIQAIASSTPVILRSINGQRDFFSGNSKAAVIMTCIIANLLCDYNGDIYHILYRNASITKWSNSDIDLIYNNWIFSTMIYENKIDKDLLSDITNIVYNYLRNVTNNADHYFTNYINLGPAGIIKKDDCLTLLELIEQKMNCRFNDDVIKLTDFNNILSLCFAIQERWNLHRLGDS